MNGAQWVVQALRSQGVEIVFGYPGGAIMPVYDALYDGGVEHLLCRHEQGAAMAAIGYARATGKVGVCIATSGPGATNLITGLADALPVLKTHWKLCVYLVILMAAFNFFSHGTQDLYPSFLKVQHGFDAHMVSIIAVSYNIASIIGGITFGALSERIGRKKAIIIAALLSLPVIPLWAFAGGSWMLGLGAFLMQFMVQGAWGVIPSYLTELVPANTRAVLPGFVYQLGNLIASVNATLQAYIAENHGQNYGLAMAIVAGTVAIIIAVLVSFGRDTRGQALNAAGNVKK